MTSWTNPRNNRGLLSFACTALFPAAAFAQTSPTATPTAPAPHPTLTVTPVSPAPRIPLALPTPRFVIPQPDETATLYTTGEEVTTSWSELWQPMCGPGRSSMTQSQLESFATSHHTEFDNADPGSITIVDNNDGIAGGGINIIFSLSPSVPAAAIPAFTLAENYIQSLFSDPITVTISVTFQNMGSGVLGSTGSSFTTTSYTTSRNGLVNNKDTNDTIQTFLPAGSTCPVRYNGAAATVTNENTVWWTRANYKSTIGSVNGTAASMTFNTVFPWDYNPANGVPTNQFSFVDVLIHEVGHSLGFVSANDWGSPDMTSLDLFRFQSTDGSGDYNPDTTAEFKIRPRLVDYNTPNEAHNSDLITVEYKMSDGSPWQGSHFKEQPANIGLMDPALAWGQTFYPNYYKTSDLNMLDAIGYDN